MTAAHIYIDGSFRSQYGIAGIGFVLLTPREGEITEDNDTIPESETEQTFEIDAAIRALETALENGHTSIVLKTDSHIIDEQVNGNPYHGNEHQQERGSKLRSVLENFDDYHVSCIDREHNERAHELARRAVRQYEATLPTNDQTIPASD